MCFGKKQKKPEPTPVPQPGPPVQSVIESAPASPASQYRPTTTATSGGLTDATGAKTVLGA